MMVTSSTTEAPQVGCRFIETLFKPELHMFEFQRLYIGG